MPVWKRGNEEDFILDLPPEKGIVCYGAGSFAKRMLPYMQKHFKQIEFCDASREKQANGYYGYDPLAAVDPFFPSITFPNRYCTVGSYI